MSALGSLWAYQIKTGKSSIKAVLVALARYANEDHEAYRSIENLEQDTELDRKTIFKCLQYLSGQGLINDTGKRTGKTGRTVVYLLPHLAAFESKIKSSQNWNYYLELNSNSPKNGTNNSPKNGTNNSPKNGTHIYNNINSIHTMVDSPESTDGQEPDLFGSDRPQPFKKSCPHEEILLLAKEILPEMPAAMLKRWKGSSKAKDLERRWNEDEEHQSLEWWSGFFHTIRMNDHWMGRNRAQFRPPSIAWFFARRNFDNVLELWQDLSDKGVWREDYGKA